MSLGQTAPWGRYFTVRGGIRLTLLTRKEAAARLGISVTTLDAERADGYLAYIQRKPGSKVWITEAVIEEYLARATRPARQTARHRRA